MKKTGQAKKILIIRLGAIGDVVHSSIIQQSIKTKYPDSIIHFLTTYPVSTLLENDINLSKVILFDNKKKNSFFYLLKLAMGFRKEKYDVIFSLTNSLRNSFITLIANPKKTVKRNKQRVHAVDAFFNSAKEVFADIEKPEKQKLYLNKSVIEKVKKQIQNYPKPHITISAGGENDKHRQGRILPLNIWIELCNQIAETTGGTIFICGSQNEKDYQTPLKKIKSSVFLTGELSLAESSALYEISDLFISGDSGPMHIAAALNTKVIGIMGSTSEHACKPYGKDNYTFVSPYKCIGCDEKYCSKIEHKIYTPCMLAVKPEDIFEAIKNLELIS